MKYTEKFHAERLIKMLSREAPCDCCPAQKHFKIRNGFLSFVVETQLFTTPSDACVICKEFVGLNKFNHGCPCTNLGKKGAVKKTTEVLIEKGYL